MKTVILLRHAKSDWSDTTQRDFDRPLNGRGERAAALMGQWAKREALTFDAIIASPAARVKDTLRTFMGSYGTHPEPAWDQRVYLASAAMLADVISEADDAADTLLLVAHNPGLADFVLEHVPDDDESALRDDVAEKFPTAAIAILDFPISHWRDFAKGCAGQLRRFIRPRDLDPALGPEQF
ncbi:MAG: histidine phosphatase family protein [Sphingobium sp.]|nr:histidine phosphatase family protein [Sphingobium sp.]